MLEFALRHMAVRRAKLLMVSLSIVVSCCVALLAYNISTKISEGIVRTAANYDLIIGPAGSSTQLAMNTLFLTDKPLGTIPYSLVEEIEQSGRANSVIPFSMGDSFNEAPIVGTTPAYLEGKELAGGEMFSRSREAVVGWKVARSYGLKVGDELVTSHGLSGSGHDHAEAPLVVTGILRRTDTACDNAVFTPCETVWALHGQEHEADGEEEADVEDADETEPAAAAQEVGAAPQHTAATGAAHDPDATDAANDAAAEDAARTICAVLVRSRSIADYSALVSAYSENADYLVINPNTVLREVLENVDMSRQIV